jgi:hypothetical protein
MRRGQLADAERMTTAPADDNARRATLPPKRQTGDPCSKSSVSWRNGDNTLRWVASGLPAIRPERLLNTVAFMGSDWRAIQVG